MPTPENIERFSSRLTAFLDARPTLTSLTVLESKRQAQFGFRGGHHHANGYRVIQHDSGVDMLVGFNTNFSDKDLFVRVIHRGEEIERGSGASVQFNFRDPPNLTTAGRDQALSHHLRVNAGQTLSRDDLRHRMRTYAPVSFHSVEEWLNERGDSVALGSTSNLTELVSRLFVYAYCVEQAKRSYRNQPLLPVLRPAQDPANDVITGDAGLLGIDPDRLVVVLHSSMAGTSYQRFAERPIRLPRDTKCQPSRKALEYRKHTLGP